MALPYDYFSYHVVNIVKARQVRSFDGAGSQSAKMSPFYEDRLIDKYAATGTVAPDKALFA
jgi:hypothetical protein